MNDYTGILSLLIFCIEIVLLINILIFSKSKFKNNIVVILSLLSAYQFFEFLICGLKLDEGCFIFLAFVSITFLPPSGLTFILKLNKKSTTKLNGLIYSPAIFFTIYFLLTMNIMRVKECSVFYAIYFYPLGFLYGLFYYIPIILSIYFLILGIIKNPEPIVRRQNLILFIGFLSFLLPMLVSLIIYPQSRHFIESLMCKFAFAFAVILSYFALKFKK